MRRLKTTMLFSLAAVCLLSVFATGCNDKDGDSLATGEPSYVVPVPENKVADTVPGDELKGTVGDTLTYKDKVKVNFTAVREIDSIASADNGRVLLCEMSITNTSSEPLPVSFLTHFNMTVDGETQNIYSALATQQSNKYYGNDDRIIHEELAAGDTVTGTVAINTPFVWSTLSLNYRPYRYYTNDEFVLEIPTDKIEHIKATN